MDKKPNEIHENLIPMKIKQSGFTLILQQKTNIPYNWPAGSYIVDTCLHTH